MMKGRKLSDLRVALFCVLLLSQTISDVDSLAAKGKKPSSGRSVGGGFGSKITTRPYFPDESDATKHLLKFLKGQKAEGLGNVEIGHSSETSVRGLFANKNFNQGQMLCKIPSDCALALSDPENNGEDSPTLAHGGANFLEMYMKPANARKLWSPYLDTLPSMESTQFDPTPDFFSDEELQLFEFPRLVRQARERREQIEELAVERGLPLDELRFATWLAASRAFCVSMTTERSEDIVDKPRVDERGQVVAKSGEQKAIRVLVPFIDMANHNSDQPNAKLTLIDPEKDEAWFALEATRRIGAGKEVVIAYGNGVESSVELLLNYGFVPRSNRIDEFMLKKGGDEAITSLDGWTTTLDEDKIMLSTIDDSDDESCRLRKILNFRIRLKESYNFST